MASKKNRFTTSSVLAIATVELIVSVVFVSRDAAASTYKVLYTFKTEAEGEGPQGNLVMDGAGNLYGTTAANVFKLTPHPDGVWTETVLHTFSGPDGEAPLAGVTLDAAGNLYGTTSAGGAFCPDLGGCGLVFKLTHNPDGTWTEKRLWSFRGPHFPQGGVVLDKAGNLYGTTYNGGDVTCEAPNGCGIVFKLAPNREGIWNLTPIHKFTGSPDGRNPKAGVTFDALGNLYGTTIFGGADTTESGGTIFKLSPNPDGTWTETVLRSFTGVLGDGAYPIGGVTVVGDSLYATTAYGGELNCFGGRLKIGCGTVSGFILNGDDGAVPVGTVTVDDLGNVYGTASVGGNLNCNSPFGCGVVFKLSGGLLTVLHVFEDCGNNPDSGLIMDADGNLYGTVVKGTDNNGLVFEITP